MRLYVNIYSVGQGYGGPEEGDWWFATGTPVGAVPVELTDDDWDDLRLEAVEKGVLNEDFTKAMLDYDAHQHSDWCRPDEHDIQYLGDEIPPFSARCHENAWRQLMYDFLHNKASLVRKHYEGIYPSTGKQYSVLGGDDYEVVIEPDWPTAYPQTKPHYE